jgi:hypothetical protein
VFARWNPMYGVDGRAACGLFDDSKSTTNTTLVDETTTVTTQTDQSGNSGLNFSDVKGAVGLVFNTDETHNLSSYESHVTTDHGSVAAGRDVSLAGLSTVQRVNADSLELLAGLVDKTIDASKTITRDSAESHASFVDQAIAGFGALAKQTSESGDDKIIRVVGFALAAVAAAVVLPAMFKSGGKAVIA